MKRFHNLGVIKNDMQFNLALLDEFVETIDILRSSKAWKKSSIIDLFNRMIPEFDHKETGKYYFHLFFYLFYLF